MQPDSFLEKLDEVLQRDDHQALADLCRRLSDELRRSRKAFPAGGARKVLDKLTKHRHFEQSLLLSSVFLSGHENDPVLQYRYGQALIEQGQAHAAVPWLLVRQHNLGKRIRKADRSAITEEELQNWEKAQHELTGFIGRAYKQLFVESGNPNHLQSAVHWYNECRKLTPEEVWGGINLVALLARAEKDGIPVEQVIDHRAFAEEIRDHIQTIENPSHWDFATLAEAHLALGRPDEAAGPLAQYCDHPESDRFALASTLRQFEELWDLDESDDPRYVALIDRLRAGLVGKQGGEVITSAGRINQVLAQHKSRYDELERVFTSTGPLPRTWFLEAAQCSKFVGRVWNRTIKGWGTGFLVKDGGDLYEGWRSIQVFVTCNHVVADELNEPGALHPDEVSITFDALEDPFDSAGSRRYKVSRLLWESHCTDLDVSIVQLDQVEDRILEGDALNLIKAEDRMPECGEERLYIIGHPMGGELSFSFQDNEFLGRSSKRIQYLTPTHPGNSGSPVFDQNFNVVAMHHAGDNMMKSVTEPNERIQANQGIPIPAIINGIHDAMS